MARRRSSEGGASFDSLLDTMFNVVGILVIMLVVTLLGVREAVRRIKWELPDISESKLREFRELAEQKKDKESDALASIEEAARVLARLKELEEEIAVLKAMLSEEDLDKRLAELRKRIEELRKQQQKHETDLKTDSKERRQLLEEIAKLPESSPDAQRVIRMPNPRSAPKDSSCVWFFCRGNRIAKMDTDELLETALRRIASSRYMLVAQERGRNVTVPADQRRRHPVLREAANWVFDPDKLVRYFEERNLGNADFRITVQIHPTLKKERLFASMREDGGEGMDRLQTHVSRFESDIRAMKGRSEYARFIVAPDSFEIYVRAREIAERHEIPAGWMLHTSDEWQVAWDFGIHVLGETTPKPAPTPVAAGDKPKPPPPTPMPILD